MSEKTNYNTQKISCQDATLVFGGISKDKAIKSALAAISFWLYAIKISLFSLLFAVLLYYLNVADYV